jgi:hypothetical protein
MARIAGLATLFLAGCFTARVGDFSLIANQNVPLRMEVMQRGITGEDCKLQVGFGPAAFPTIEAAVSNAQAKVPDSDALQNVVVEYSQQYRLWNYNCYRITADAVRLAPRAEAPRPTE